MRTRNSFKPRIELLEERSLLSVLPLYYSADGTGNNVTHPLWGAAGTDLLRKSGTAYGDGIASMAGATRPDTRVISNTIAVQLVDPEPNSRNMSDMIYAWGQFIDHDLDLTPAGTTEYDPIAAPAGDPVFSSNIPFFRAVTDPTTGNSKSNPREQPNVISSFLDGSVIYGDDSIRAAALRSGVGGQLKTSPGDLLPFVGASGLPENVDIPGVDPTTLFLTGDVRGNENIELESLEVLFVREHNYWASTLQTQHPTWTDEQLYQGARQIVVAEIQNITYTEFLPALLGANAMTPYRGYNPNVNPTVAAEFSEGAFRVGHSLLNGNVDFFNNDGSESHDPLDFSASADDPSQLLQDGTSVDNILKYLVADNSQEVDNQVEDAFRNFLFDPTNAANGGLDLYAIDIQRGRDLGLPEYNTERAAYGLPKVTSFNQITSDPTVQAELRQLYGTITDAQGKVHDNVNNVDMFVGGLAENHVKGGSLGPLFTRIIADQFQRTRAGDRLWYQRIFSGADLQRIQNTTLDDIIARNTSITNLQHDAFFFTTGTISGHVFADANGNVSQDAGEHGLAGIYVMLFDDSGQLLARTRTAADGTYHFDNLNQGSNYKVVVIPSDNMTGTSPLMQEVDLVDNSGAGEFDVDFGLARLHPLSSSVLRTSQKTVTIRNGSWAARHLPRL
jgi:peroxidase